MDDFEDCDLGWIEESDELPEGLELWEPMRGQADVDWC